MLKNNSGVTFIEVLVSVSLVVIIAAAVTQSVVQIAKTQKISNNKLQSQSVQNKLVAILSNENICVQNFQRSVGYPDLRNQLNIDSFRQGTHDLDISPADINSDPVVPTINPNINYSAAPGSDPINGFVIKRLDFNYKTNSTPTTALLSINFQVQDSAGKLYPVKSMPLWVEFDPANGNAIKRCSVNTAEQNMGGQKISATLCSTFGPQYYGTTTDYFGNPAVFYIDANGNCTYNSGVSWDYIYSPENTLDPVNTTITTNSCPSNTVQVGGCGAYTDWSISQCPPEFWDPVNRVCQFGRPATNPNAQPFFGIPEAGTCNTDYRLPGVATCTWPAGTAGWCLITCLVPNGTTTTTAGP